MNKFYQKCFRNTLTIALTVLVSSLAVVGILYAATTIGTNITTDGNLSVVGNATTTGNFIVGTSNWLAPTSTLTVNGSAYFTGGMAVSGSATTTGNFIVGTSNWRAPTSTLSIIGSAHFMAGATSSSYMWVGTGGVTNNVDLAGGDLYVQGSAEIDGSIWTGAATITGKATTTGSVVFASADPGATATSTVTFGSYGGGDTKGLCMKFFSGGVTIWCYFNTALIGSTATSTALICSTNNCETN